MLNQYEGRKIIMKKILMAAVALTALTATPAMAVTPVGQSFDVTGNVASACASMTGGTAAFGTITPGADGKVTSGTASTVSQSVYCNSAGSKISYSSTGKLLNASPAAVGAAYTKELSYNPVVTLGGTQVAADGSTDVSSGTLVVSASGLSSNSLIPIAGDYAGSITVTLTPGA
jgi:hypothetical protein